MDGIAFLLIMVNYYVYQTSNMPWIHQRQAEGKGKGPKHEKQCFCVLNLSLF